MKIEEIRDAYIQIQRERERGREKKKEKKKMGSRLGRRVIHFANLPIKLLMPSSFQNIKEIALKTIPSATKVEIKRVLQNLYGFDVEEVRTLNMEGKKKKRGGILIAKPDYKKAYVTLKTPLSLSPNLYPIRLIEEEKKNTAPKKSQSGVVEDSSAPSHWLHGEGNGDDGDGIGRGRRFKKTEKRPVKQVDGSAEKSKFPWSSMRSWR